MKELLRTRAALRATRWIACLFLLTTFAGDLRADVLRVVTSIPDLADIAKEIGGERVEVTSLAKGTQNVHAVRLRPSAMVAMNRADVFIEMGLSMEHAYVPALIMKAGNDSIEPGAKGFINCSDGWKAIEVPDEVSRGMSADLHPMGNPHFNLDPRGGEHMARRIHAGFVRVQPDSKEYFDQRLASYLERLEEATKRWEGKRASLKGKRVLAYHNEFSYLAAYFGMDVVGTVEAKAGVPPTPKDLARTVQLLKREKVGVILTAKWSNNKSVRFLAEKSGARVYEVPVMVGGAKGADSWIEMMDLLVDTLAGA